jgi:hypothetical protein
MKVIIHDKPWRLNKFWNLSVKQFLYGQEISNNSVLLVQKTSS